jgi:transposase
MFLPQRYAFFQLNKSIAKDEIQICFRESMSDGSMRIRVQKKVANTKTGWNMIDTSIRKNLKADAPQGFLVVMEATGVYHENVCYYLSNQGYCVSVSLPNDTKCYIKSLGQKSKNDKIDAQALAQMGLERQLDIWVAPSASVLRIKQLTRERQLLIEEQTSIKNQLHAFEHGYEVSKDAQKRFALRLKLIAKQIKEIDELLVQAVEADNKLKTKVERICTIKGFGIISAIILIAETNAFANFDNRAQLTSYAGYDVVENQSGNRAGKTRISKRGNAHIRRCLHFPALAAIRHDDDMKQLYERVFDRTKIKMKACVAVQRKMLLLAYALCKNETDFDPQYKQKTKPETK